jgi:hypothetical protein
VFKVFVSVCVVVCCSRINSARTCRTVRSPACNELLTGGMQATALTLPHNLMACHDIVHAQLKITNRYLQKSKS